MRFVTFDWAMSIESEWQSGVEVLNTILVSVATLVILTLLTALVGPYFVDWTVYRTTFESYATRVTGVDVQVRGDVDLRLLPEPRLRFTEVTVGDQDAPLATVGVFDMHIALTPLMSGEIKILGMTLDQPHLNVTIEETGVLRWPEAASGQRGNLPDGVDVMFSNVQLTSGSMLFRYVKMGRAVSVQNIGLNFNAPSLRGPYKLEGGGLVDGAPVDVSVATGVLQPEGLLRVKSRLAPTAGRLVLTSDGALDLGGGDASYEGTFQIATVEPASAGAVDESTAAIVKEAPTLAIDGSVRIDIERMLIPNANVQIGTADEGLAVNVNGSVEFVDDPRFQAVLSSRQLDVDRIFGASAAEPLSVSSAVALLTECVSDLPAPGLPGDLSVNVPGLVIGGAIVRDLRFHATTTGEFGGWRVGSINAVLPGETKVSASGRMDATQEEMSFDGLVTIDSRRPAALAAWWQPDKANSNLAFAPMSLTGRLLYGQGGFALSDAVLQSGESRLNGTLAWQAGGDDVKSSLFAAFDADHLDFEAALATSGSLTQLMPAMGEASLANGIPNLDIRMGVKAIEYRGSEVGGVNIEMNYLDDALTITALDIEDLAGVQVSAGGRIDDVTTTASGSLSAQISADEIEALKDLVSRQAPGSALVGWLDEAAPSLTGIELSATLRAAEQGDGTRAKIIIAGTAGGTVIQISAGFQGTIADWANGSTRFNASFAGGDDFRLATQLGYQPDFTEFHIAGFNPPAILPGRLLVELSGQPSERMTASLSGDLLGLGFEYDGFLDALMSTGQPALEGRLSVHTDDLGRAWSTTGKLPPFGSEPVAADVTANIGGGLDKLVLSSVTGQVGGIDLFGDLEASKASGQWSLRGDLSVAETSLGALMSLAATPTVSGPVDEPEGEWPTYIFGEPAFGALTFDLGLETERLTLRQGLVARDVTLSLSYTGSELRISDLQATLANGKLEAAATLKQVQGVVEVSMQATVIDAQLENFVWQVDGLPVATGLLRLGADVDGLGRSVASIVDSLSGTGAVALENVRIRGLAPQAFDAVTDAVDAGLNINNAAVLGTFEQALKDRRMQAAAAEAALTINSGTARLRNMAFDSEGQVLADAALNFITKEVSSNWTLRGASTTSDDLVPQANVSFDGPLAAPTRSVDVSPLIAFLTLRNVEKQVDTIERLERDRTREEERLKELERQSTQEDALLKSPFAPTDGRRQASSERPSVPHIVQSTDENPAHSVARLIEAAHIANARGHAATPPHSHVVGP